MAEITRVTTLEGLLDAIKARRKQLGLSQLLVDEISGLQGGYTGKLEAGMKGLGKVSIPLLLGALKLELAVMSTDASGRKHPAEIEDFWSRKSRKMNDARQRKVTPKQRRKIARAAAKARWRKE